ncbi:hypothetical protein Lal_00021303 [Lupinus albus]|nr:hypothetical protein Lal_00021303 [Lupinus albus]
MLNRADETGAFGTLSEISDQTSCMEPVQLMKSELPLMNGDQCCSIDDTGEFGETFLGMSLERERYRLGETGSPG